MAGAIRALDLAGLASSPVVNYLHPGQEIDLWGEVLQKGGSVVARRHLLRHLSSRPAVRSDLETLVRGYLPLRKKLSLAELQQALRESKRWREQFHALGCRGFSYELDLEMKGYNRQHVRSCQLGPGINLRIALMPAKELFYPPRVRNYFRRVSWYNKHHFFNKHSWYSNHYFFKELPSIAFCLGKKTDQAWFVFVMQSNLASRGPSYVRDHLRGWRNILFANVVAHARGKTGAVYLCRAEDVERACFPGSKEPGRVPDLWRTIYDGTAVQWGMRLIKLGEPVDVQLYRAVEPVLSEYFYEFPLFGRPEVSATEQQEALCAETP